jgi:DNA-binding transcriptional MerR regulator
MVKKINSKQIEKLSGLKANTLHYYIQAGALEPDVNAGQGTGTQRLFSVANLFEATLISRLINLGMPRRAIVAFMKDIRKNNDRKRMDPETIMVSKYVELLIFHQDKGQYVHKFVTDGGKKHKLARAQFNKRIAMTSWPKPEDLMDIFTVFPLTITINLTMFADFILAVSKSIDDNNQG